MREHTKGEEMYLAVMEHFRDDAVMVDELLFVMSEDDLLKYMTVVAERHGIEFEE